MDAIGREGVSGNVSAYDVARLQQSYEHSYSRSSARDWEFHDTADPVMRYLRDRRLGVAVNALSERLERFARSNSRWRVPALWCNHPPRATPERA